MLKKCCIVLAIIAIIGILGGLESTYKREATVIDTKGDIVVCVDSCGFSWEYKGQAEKGEKVVLIMNDNHTSTIKDDIIKGVEKAND